MRNAEHQIGVGKDETKRKHDGIELNSRLQKRIITFMKGKKKRQLLQMGRMN